jgi:hypothetical protein
MRYSPSRIARTIALIDTIGNFGALILSVYQNLQPPATNYLACASG